MKKQNQVPKNGKATWPDNLVCLNPTEEVYGVDFVCNADISLEHPSLFELSLLLLRMWTEMKIPAEIRRDDKIGVGKTEVADSFYLHHSRDLGRDVSGRDLGLAATSCLISRRDAINCLRSFQSHAGFGSPIIRTLSLEEKEAEKEALQHTDLRPLLPSWHKDSGIVPGQELWGMDFDFLGQELDRDLAAMIGRNHCEQVTVDVSRFGRFTLILNRMNAGREKFFDKTLTRSEAAEILSRLCEHPLFQCSYICTRGC